ncbi:MAG: DUF3102 domain-containing protein [Bacteroidota bacterium]
MAAREPQSPDVDRSPELIAREINDIKDRTRRMLLYNSIEIGRRLCEAKEKVPHGEWGKWLEESVDYSQSTANNLMRIFKEYSPKQMNLLDNEVKSQTFGKLSYSQAVALLGVPEEDREEFVEEHDVPEMSVRELKEVIKERDQALEEKEQVEEELEKVQEKASEKEEKAKEFLEEKQKAENELLEIEKEKKEAKKRMAELEEELEERPVEVSTVEKVPEEIEKELAALREKVKKADEEEHITKFKLLFDELTGTFKELLKELSQIQDEDAKNKYSKAVKRLISKMNERLE